MTFRDDRPCCPVCPDDRALDPQPGFETRLRCSGCRSVMIPNGELVDMIVHLTHQPWTLEALTNPRPGPLTCPHCKTKMETCSLFAVPVDRCAVHGVWFGVKQLAMALEAASGVDPYSIEEGSQYAERGLGEKIKGWFTSKDPTTPRRPKDGS